MNWWEGTVNEAIENSKSSKKILLVYIYAKDDPGSEALLNSLTACYDAIGNFVCIRLEASSVEAAQLNVYYPVMVIPLIYLISHDGCALVSICGKVSPEEVRCKLEEATRSQAEPPAAATPELPIPTEPNTSNASATPPAPEAGRSADVTDSPSQYDDASAAAVAAATVADAVNAGKAEYARQRLEEVRKRKEEEEREKARAAELERRSVGQSMGRLRDHQREQEQKELREELRRRKVEEKEARDRVRRQIEEDRRESNARRAARGPAAATPQETAPTPAPASTRAAAAEGDARLQFRLPDGSNVVRVFRATDRLSVAYDFIRRELDGRFGEFRISSLYPRRLFVAADMEATLAALSLAPSAAVVVLPGRASTGGRRSGAAVGAGGQDSGPVALVQTWLVDPLLALIGLVWGLIVGMLSSLWPRAAANTNSSSSGSGASGGDVAPPAQEPERSEEAREAREEQGGVRRRPGNITRLGDLPRDDEDTNTWNGNSTQQM